MAAKGSGSGVGCGVTIGCALAAVLSWISNASLVWAVIHGFFGWIYVIYWLLVKN
jgi:hypothetical protein